MEINWSTVGWIIAIVVLYLFGYYEGRSVGYKRRKKEEEKEKKDLPPPPPQTITETVTVTVDDPGMLRVKNEQGTLTLDLDGARVDPAALPPEQRKRLIEILGIMRPWLEGRPAPASTPAPVADAHQGIPPPIAPAPQASLLDRMHSKPAQPPPTPPSVQSPSSPPPAKPEPPASKPATIAKEDRPSAPPNSIVAQIDSVLQSRLVGTPLEGRGIFLTQSPEGGVNVYIGLTRYSGIDEVPEPEIKAAIRAAITEWEQKFTPGLK